MTGLERKQDVQRLVQIQKNWDFYRGDQVHYLETEDQSFIAKRGELTRNEIDAIGNKIRVPLNYTRLVVERYLNGCYGLEVARTLEDKGNQSVLNEIWRNNQMGHFMLGVQRVAEIEGMCAVIPRWKEEQGRIAYEKYGAQHLIPIEMPDDPSQLYALILSWTAENKWGLTPDIVEGNLPNTRNLWRYTPSKNGGKSRDIRYGNQKYVEIWTNESVQAYLGRDLLTDTVNPYGEIPFAFFRAGEDDGSFFGQTPVNDVVAVNHVINRLLSDLIEVIRVHGFSLLFVSGDMTDELILKPTSFLKAPSEGTAQYLTPNSPIREIQDFIDWFIKRLADVAQVPEATISGGFYEESGYALTIRWLPYTQMLTSRRANYSVADKDLIRKTLLVSSVHAGRGNPALWDASVDFLDQGFMPPHKGEELQYDAFLLEKSVITPLDLMKKEFPQLDEEQSMEKFLMNIRINNAIKLALSDNGSNMINLASNIKEAGKTKDVGELQNVLEQALQQKGVDPTEATVDIPEDRDVDVQLDGNIFR